VVLDSDGWSREPNLTSCGLCLDGTLWCSDTSYRDSFLRHTKCVSDSSRYKLKMRALILAHFSGPLPFPTWFPLGFTTKSIFLEGSSSQTQIQLRKRDLRSSIYIFTVWFEVKFEIHNLFSFGLILERLCLIF